MLLQIKLVSSSEYLLPQTVQAACSYAVHIHSFHKTVSLYTVTLLPLYSVYCLLILLLNTKGDSFIYLQTCCVCFDFQPISIHAIGLKV